MPRTLRSSFTPSGADFIFGVAFGEATDASYVWDSANAAALLRYIAGNCQKIWGFELGNEVNNGVGTAASQAHATVQFAATSSNFDTITSH